MTPLDIAADRTRAGTPQPNPTAPPPRLLVVESDRSAGLGRLAAPLSRGLPGMLLDVVRPYPGHPRRSAAVPTSPAGYSGVIVLGGHMAAWDDEAAPWLPATRRLLRTAVQDRVPALGICLGAQLLALATGGQVRRGQSGPEIGLRQVELLACAAQDRLLGGVPVDERSRFRSVQWHRDAITLPPDAVPLAVGALYPHQAFRVGECAWAVQFHPEVTLHDFDAWVADGAEDLRVAGMEPRETRARVHAAEADLQRLADVLGGAFAGVVQAVIARDAEVS